MSHISTKHHNGLPPPTLTILRSMVVNADFLAYLCLRSSFDGSQADITFDASTSRPSTTMRSIQEFFWQSMRCSGWDISLAQEATRTRYLERQTILEIELDGYPVFAWALLARMAPDKFFSDIVEAVIGAIFIDSGGDLFAVEGFLTHLGILGYVDRLLDALGRVGDFKPGSNEKGVKIMHPKMQLQDLAQAQQKALDWSDIRKGDDRRYAGFVTVDGVAVGTVENALSQSAAETIATDEGVRMLLGSKVAREDGVLPTMV